MKRILILLFVLNGWQSFSQNVEVNTGMNHNSFFCLHSSDLYNSDFRPDYGYQIGIGINEFRPDTVFNFRFTFNFINYGGGFNVSTASPSSGDGVYGSVNKSVLSLGFYPFNFKVAKRVDFNLGVELSSLVWNNTTGTAYSWAMTSSNVQTIDEKYKHFNSSLNLGISARVAYPIRINSYYSICPQVGCYVGFLPGEFSDVAARVKSFRQYFSIGIQRKL